MTTVILRPDAFDAPDSQAQTEAFIAWCKQSPHDPDAPVLAPGEWEAANREARLPRGSRWMRAAGRQSAPRARRRPERVAYHPLPPSRVAAFSPAERLTSALCVIVISDEVTLPSSSI